MGGGGALAYTPTRNDNPSTFPHDRTVLYTFALAVPATESLTESDEALDGEVVWVLEDELELDPAPGAAAADLKLGK